VPNFATFIGCLFCSFVCPCANLGWIQEPSVVFGCLFALHGQQYILLKLKFSMEDHGSDMPI